MMGRKKVDLVDQHTMKLDETLYVLIDGLWLLINDKDPKPYSATNPSGYTDENLETYTKLLYQTDVINHPSNTNRNSRPHTAKKFLSILSHIEER